MEDDMARKEITGKEIIVEDGVRVWLDKWRTDMNILEK